MKLKLYWCGCRCGCSVVIVGEDNQGCTFCMDSKEHKKDLAKRGIIKYQFNPLMEVK